MKRHIKLPILSKRAKITAAIRAFNGFFGLSDQLITLLTEIILHCPDKIDFRLTKDDIKAEMRYASDSVFNNAIQHLKQKGVIKRVENRWEYHQLFQDLSKVDEITFSLQS